MNKVKLSILIAMGVVGYIAWGLIACFIDRSQMSGFLGLNITMVTGVIGLALRDMKYPNEPTIAPPAAPPKDTP